MVWFDFFPIVSRRVAAVFLNKKWIVFLGDQQVYVVLFVALLFFFSFVQNSAFFFFGQSRRSPAVSFLGVLGEPNLQVDFSVSGSDAVILNGAVLLF